VAAHDAAPTNGGSRWQDSPIPNSSFCPRLHSAKIAALNCRRMFRAKPAGKIVDKLTRAGLLEEVGASGSLPVWRRDDESGAIALRITSAGLAAIAAADEVMVTPEENGERHAARSDRLGGKRGP
jgi:hypothetical protein